MRGRRRERLRVESRVHDTNLRSVGEQNRCQVGPTILFECPAQIPRSFLRSFSLWARHPAETSAELNVRLGAAEFFPGQQAGATGEEAAEGRKCEGGAGNGSGRESVHDTNLRSVGCAEPLSGGAHNSSSSAPPRSPAPPSDHFPFGPAILRRRVPS